jgi:zona occludens toxin (predicted ATPase)
MMLPGLQRRLADSGAVVVGGPDYLARIHASTQNQPLAVNDCGPGEQFLFIDETGLISPCSFTSADYSVPVRDIATVDDLAALPTRFRAMRSTRRAFACDDCLSTQVSGKFACKVA